MGVLSSESKKQKTKGGEKRAVENGKQIWNEKRGEGVLKGFTKAVLYVYPTIEEINKAYAEHIRNKAELSYKHFGPAEGLIEYVARQVCKRDKLVWLKQTVRETLDELSDVERALVERRYFCNKKGTVCALDEIDAWSESTYFRRQKKLEGRIEHRLICKGLTEQVFDEWFAPMEIFRCALRYLQKKEESQSRVNLG